MPKYEYQRTTCGGGVDLAQVVKPGDNSLYSRSYLTGSSKRLYVYHSEEQNTSE